MQKIFMSVVGTGNYTPANYLLGDQSCSNRFVQKALLSMLKEQGVQYDRIIFFLTKEAREKNWEAFRREIRKGTEIEVIEDEGLHPFLKRAFPDSQICDITIASGEKEEEFLDMFRTIYEQIDEGDEITFDVTHGFRIIPLLFYPVMSYAKELKNIRIAHIYYGMFNPGQTDAPIVELNQYDRILDWANAAHNFVHFGNASEIAKLIRERYNALVGAEKRTLNAQKNLADSMEKFTDALLTCRGTLIGDAAEDCRKKMAKLPDASSDPLFYELTLHAMNSIQNFQGEKSPYEIGMETVHWCREKRLVQQAYTALKETIITYCCGIYAPEIKDAYLNFDVRERVINTALGTLAAYDATDDGHRKHLHALRPEYRKIYMRIILHVGSQDMEFFRQLGDIRNQINHFGMKNDKLSAEKIINRLDTNLENAERFLADIQSRITDIPSDAETETALHRLLYGNHRNFVNFSNHPSASWNAEQIQAALAMAPGGELLDVPFPAVPANADEGQIAELAQEYMTKILAHAPAAVMCQGEFGLCYEVIRALKAKNIRVMYSCTERCAVEQITENGAEKTSVFRFVRFREF